MNNARPTQHQQLDLFIDTQSAQMLNGILDYLLNHNAPAASVNLQQFKDTFPQDPVISELQILLAGLENREGDCREDFRHGQCVLQPLADRWFQQESARWMAHYWKLLATRTLSSLSPAAEIPLNELHPAALYLRASDHNAARNVITTLPGWRQQYETLDWMLISLLQEKSLDAAWPLLFEVAWLYPETCLARIEGSELNRLKNAHSDFEMSLPAESKHDTVWFPAWMLLREPALLPLVTTARHPDQPWGQAFETVITLLTERNSGKHSRPDLLRKNLQSLHPGLLRASLDN